LHKLRDPKWILLPIKYKELTKLIAEIFNIYQTLLVDALKTLKSNIDEGLILMEILGIRLNPSDVKKILSNDKAYYELLNNFVLRYWDSVKNKENILLDLVKKGFCPRGDVIKILLEKFGKIPKVAELAVIKLVNRDPTTMNMLPEDLIIKYHRSLLDSVLLRLPERYIHIIFEEFQQRYGDKLWTKILNPNEENIRNILLLIKLAPEKIEKFAIKMLKTKIKLPEISEEDILRLPDEYLYLLKVNKNSSFISLSLLVDYIEKNLDKLNELMKKYISNEIKLENSEIITLLNLLNKVLPKDLSGIPEILQQISDLYKKLIIKILSENIELFYKIKGLINKNIVNARELLKLAQIAGKLDRVVEMTGVWEPILKEFPRQVIFSNPNLFLLALRPYQEKAAKKFPNELIQLWIRATNKTLLKPKTLAKILTRIDDNQISLIKSIVTYLKNFPNELLNSLKMVSKKKEKVKEEIITRTLLDTGKLENVLEVLSNYETVINIIKTGANKFLFDIYRIYKTNPQALLKIILWTDKIALKKLIIKIERENIIKAIELAARLLILNHLSVNAWEIIIKYAPELALIFNAPYEIKVKAAAKTKHPEFRSIAQEIVRDAYKNNTYLLNSVALSALNNNYLTLEEAIISGGFLSSASLIFLAKKIIESKSMKILKYIRKAVKNTPVDIKLLEKYGKEKGIIGILQAIDSLGVKFSRDEILENFGAPKSMKINIRKIPSIDILPSFLLGKKLLKDEELIITVPEKIEVKREIPREILILKENLSNVRELLNRGFLESKSIKPKVREFLKYSIKEINNRCYFVRFIVKLQEKIKKLQKIDLKELSKQYDIPIEDLRIILDRILKSRIKSHKGFVYYKKEFFKECSENLIRASKENLTKEILKCLRKGLLLDDINISKEKINESVNYLLKRKEINLNDKETLLELALALEVMGKTSDAVAIYKQILIMDKNNKFARQKVENLAKIRYLVGPNTYMYAIHSVIWSQNGRYISCSTSDGNIWIWDASSGKLLRIIENRWGSINSITWSPNGRYIVSGSSDRIVRLWDIFSCKCIRTFKGHEGPIWDVAWSPDGKYIASGSRDKTVRIWDASSGKLLRILEGHTSDVNSVAWNPDGKYIASGSRDKTVRIWDASSGKLLRALKGSMGYVNSIAWSPDGKYIASSSSDRAIRIWNALSGKLLITLEGHMDSVWGIAWDSSGKYIASGSKDKTIAIWDAVSGRLIRMLNGHESYVSSVSWSPNGKYIVSGSHDKTIRIWKISSGELSRVLGSSSDSAKALKQDLNNRNRVYLRMESKDPSGKIVRTFEYHNHSVLSAIWSPNGRYFANINNDGILRIRDITSGEIIRVFGGHKFYISSISWSPNGKYIAGGSLDNTVRIWEVSSGELLRRFKGHKNLISCVAWSSDGKHIASSSIDGTIKIWNTLTGKRIRTLKGHTETVYSLAWSPDGKYIASGSVNGIMRIWNASAGELVRTIESHIGFPNNIAWSPDSRYIASGTTDRTLKIWNVSSGEIVKTLRGCRDHIYCVAWNSSGKYIAGGSLNSIVRIWRSTSGKTVSTIKLPGPILSLNWFRDSLLVGCLSGDIILISSFDER